MCFDFLYIFCLKHFQNFANAPKRRLEQLLLIFSCERHSFDFNPYSANVENMVSS